MSERAAASQVSEEESGDLRHMEGLRRDYRRLRDEGNLPAPSSSADHEQAVAAAISEEYRQRSETLPAAKAELARLEKNLAGIDIDPSQDMRKLAASLDAQRARIKAVIHGLPPSALAAHLASQGFPDEESAHQEYLRLSTEYDFLGEVIEMVRRIDEIRMKIQGIVPQSDPPSGEQ